MSAIFLCRQLSRYTPFTFSGEVNVSIQIKVLIRLQSCQNVAQIAGFFFPFLAGEQVLGVSRERCD